MCAEGAWSVCVTPVVGPSMACRSGTFVTSLLTGEADLTSPVEIVLRYARAADHSFLGVRAPRWSACADT